SKTEAVEDVKKITSLSESVLIEHISILQNHLSTNRSALEKSLGVFFESYESDAIQHNRIKSIKVHKRPFSLEVLLDLWSQTEPLKKLSK
ncbi:hypothetical protein R0K17_24090, partial [Planococcus sp. SIMBA_143]